jgi:chromosome segregation ATPase
LEKQQQSYKQLQESLGKDKDSYGKMIDELNYKITAYSRENNTLRQETNRNLEGLNKEKRQLETEKMLLLNKLKEKDMLIEKMRSDSNSKSEQYTARIQKLEEDLRMLRGKISEGEQR